MFESFDFQQMISAFIVLFAVIDIIFFSCRNRPDYTFRFRNDSYFKCKLCVKPQQPSFFRDLYLYRKRIADTRTVLVNPRDEKPSRPNIYPVANSIFVHILNIHRFQYGTH